MRIVYLGSPEFAVAPLELLLEAGHRVVGVVTAPGRPAGRGRQLTDPPLALAARARGLTVHQPEKASSPEFRELLASWQVDAAITAAYGQYLNTAFLALPRHGVLNIHPSLLPRWRGASPVMSALLAGDPYTGVTVLRSARRMDAGPILAQQRVEIEEEETAGELTARLFRRGGELLLGVLERLEAGVQPEQPQDEALATGCTKVSRESARLSWEPPAPVLARQVRAFNPTPVAWTTWEGRLLRVWRARPVEGQAPDLPPGTLLAPQQGQGPRVVCGTGSLLLEEIQLEGSRRMPAAAAWRGMQGEARRTKLE